MKGNRGKSLQSSSINLKVRKTLIYQKKKMPTNQNSEVDAYVFIKETLEILGWNTKNPARHSDGQVYTQGECLSHPQIKKALGQTKPENIIKLTETKFWVIESKRNHNQLQQALKEAREYYAKKINEDSQVKTVIITGVAGNRTTP